MSRTAVVAALLLVVSAAGAGFAPAVAGSGEAPAGADATPDATIYHEGDRLNLAAAGGQVVRGNTTLEPGSHVNVRIRAPVGKSPFYERARAIVQSDGEFVVVFGLEDAVPGTNFTATVSGPDGKRLVDELPGRVVEGDVNLGLPDSSIEVRPGETARLPIVLDEGADATLTIATPDVGYELTATIRDGDDDGVVDLRYDTAVAGTDGDPLSTVDAADDVTVESEASLGSSLPEGRYYVSLAHDGADLSVGTVTVDDPTRTATPTPTAPASGSPEFEETVIVSYAGETAELRFLLGDASAATVSIGGDDVNWIINATVRDGNGDNQVRLRFDTSAAGTARTTLWAADDADVVTVSRESDLASPPLAPGEYPVTVFAGDDASGEAVDIATIILEEGRDRSPTPTDTPTSTATPTTTATPTAAVETSSPVDPGVVALGGIAVVGLGAAALLSRRRRWL